MLWRDILATRNRKQAAITLALEDCSLVGSILNKENLRVNLKKSIIVFDKLIPR